MKKNSINLKAAFLASVLSLGLMDLAGAAQYVYMTGSTAARGATYSALISSNVFDSVPTFVGYSSSTASKCTYMAFSGTITISGVPTAVIVKCTWSGSEGGIRDISTGLSEPFLNDPGVGGVDSSNTGNTNTPSGTQLITNTVDLAMADNDKAFSKNPNGAITGTKVCIIPFAWVREKGSSSALTNVTDQQLRQVMTGGAKLALFTGNPLDTNYVYVTGRDSESGTRVNAYGESGYGIFTSAFQIQVNSDGTMKDQSGLGDYVGDYGYSSGSGVAGQMGINITNIADPYNNRSNYNVIAYLGRSDANSAVNNGGTELSLNGVFESPATVKEGQYNFWGNEFVYRKNTTTTQAQAVYDKLAAPTGISGSSDGSTTIDLGLMHATRAGPTTDPTHP
jgi:hypothetical protein